MLSNESKAKVFLLVNLIWGENKERTTRCQDCQNQIPKGMLHWIFRHGEKAKSHFCCECAEREMNRTIDRMTDALFELEEMAKKNKRLKRLRYRELKDSCKDCIHGLRKVTNDGCYYQHHATQCPARKVLDDKAQRRKKAKISWYENGEKKKLSQGV